jgi:hypothetical protein
VRHVDGAERRLLQMRKLRRHQRVQLRMLVIRVSGFKGLFYKPLEKQVVLTNPDIKEERDTR